MPYFLNPEKTQFASCRTWNGHASNEEVIGCIKDDSSYDSGNWQWTHSKPSWVPRLCSKEGTGRVCESGDKKKLSDVSKEGCMKAFGDDAEIDRLLMTK